MRQNLDAPPGQSFPNCPDFQTPLGPSAAPFSVSRRSVKRYLGPQQRTRKQKNAAQPKKIDKPLIRMRFMPGIPRRKNPTRPRTPTFAPLQDANMTESDRIHTSGKAMIGHGGPTGRLNRPPPRPNSVRGGFLLFS